MNAAALSAFDVQATTELQNLQLSLQQTYGNSYATTQEYSIKLSALRKHKARSCLRCKTNKPLPHNSLLSKRGAGSRLLDSLRHRGRAINGDPGRIHQAALSAFDAQAAADLDNLKLSFRTNYGDAYTTTAAYAAKITSLQKAQGEELSVLQTQTNHARSCYKSLPPAGRNLRCTAITPPSRRTWVRETETPRLSPRSLLRRRLKWITSSLVLPALRRCLHEYAGVLDQSRSATQRWSIHRPSEMNAQSPSQQPGLLHPLQHCSSGSQRRPSDDCESCDGCLQSRPIRDRQPEYKLLVAGYGFLSRTPRRRSSRPRYRSKGEKLVWRRHNLHRRRTRNATHSRGRR